ncbi:MAG: T9SS type A sorting domain-containing protein [Ferruginibacter sp.]
MKRIIILTIAFLDIITFTKAQTIDVSITDSSDTPGWSQQQTLPTCVGTNYLKVKAKHSSGGPTGSFTLVLLPNAHLDFSGPVFSCSAWGVSNDSLKIDFAGMTTGDSCEMLFVMQIPCTINTSLFINKFIINSSTVNINANTPTPVPYKHPKMLIDSFQTAAGVYMDDNYVQGQILTNSTFRRFNILVSDGMVDEFNFDYIPEHEIQWDSMQVQAFIADVAVSPVFTYNSSTPIPLFDATLLNTYFGYPYMKVGYKLKVKEFFKVNTCTQTAQQFDKTKYTVTWHCPNQGILPCHIFTKERRLDVKRTIGTPYVRFESLAPAFQLCGDTTNGRASTLSYKITNEHSGDLGTPGSDISTLHKIKFPLNTSWFTYDSLLVVSDSGETVLSTSLPPGFLIFSADTCILNFDTLTTSLFSSRSPVVDTFLKDGKYNEIITNRFFRLIFKGCAFHCHGNNGNNTLYEDPKSANSTPLFFGSAANPVVIRYSGMCSPSILVNSYVFMNYAYNHEMETIAETDRTDMEPGDIANIDYYFAIYKNPFNAYNSGYVFNRDTVHYFPAIEVSRRYTLDSVKYFQDPNSASFVFVQKEFTGLNAVGDSIFKLQADSMRNHYSGRLLATVRLTNCPTNTGGFDTFNIKHYVADSSCMSCKFNMRTNTVNLYHHCRGGCPGQSPVATSQFNFDRISLGWQDSVMNTVVDTAHIKIKYNRVYPCDSITMTGKGIVGNSSTGPKVDSLYFGIDYTSPNNYQYYDFLSGYYIIQRNGGARDSIPIISSGPGNQLAGDWNNINCTSCALKICLPDTVNKQRLSLGGATLTVHALIKVKSNIPGNYYIVNNFPMSQIRAQYVAVDSAHTTWESCDTWGDNMLFMNVQTLWEEKIINPVTPYVLKNENWATEGYNYPFGHDLCKRRFTLVTGVIGGYNRFDDFPGEFRPISIWPDTSKQDTLSIKFPPGLTFENAKFSAWEYDPVFKPINYDYQTSTNELKIFGYNNHGWPIIDHDGHHRITFVLSGQLNNTCPPEYRQADTIVKPDSAIIKFPQIKRAYSRDAACADQDNNTYRSVYTRLRYSFKMTNPIGVDTFKIYSITDSLKNINLNFYDSTEFQDPPNMPNVWVYAVNNPYCTVTQVKQQYQNGNATVIQNVSPVSGFYQLGTFRSRISHNLTFKIRVDSCTVETAFPLQIIYGYSCGLYPTSISNTGACKMDTLTVWIDPKNSGLSLEAFPLNVSTVSSCDTITYIATMTSNAEAEAEYPLLIIANPPGLSLITATCTTNSIQFPGGNVPIVHNGDSSLLDLNAAVYNGNGMPVSGHVATIAMKFVPLCTATTMDTSINFNAAVRNICSGDIQITNDSISTDISIQRTLVDLSADLSIASSFTNCSNPFGLNVQLNNIQHNGNVKVQGIISLPPTFTYNNSTVAATGVNPVNWNQQFSVGASASAGINFNIPASWCGLVPVQVSLLLIDSVNCSGTINCIDSLYITTVDTIYVCCDTCQLSLSADVTDFTCNTTPNGAVALNISNGHSPYVFNWSNGYHTQTITGLLPGTYSCIVIDSMGCTDSITAIVQNFDSTQFSVTPADTVICANSSITITAVGCVGCTYLWQPGGETTESITITATTDLQFTVTATTHEGCIYEATSNIKVQKCEGENFCMYVYNRDYKDEAKDIERTDDDGYIVVGSMYTANLERDMYVVKYDNNFNVQFAERVGQPSQATSFNKEQANAVIQAEKFYYVTGSVQVSDNNTDVYVVKLDQAGGIVWSKRYGGSGTEVGTGIHLLKSDRCRDCGKDGLIVTGYSNDVRGGNKFQFMAMKIDPDNGNLIKIRSYNIEEGAYGKSNASILLKDGRNIIMAGEGAGDEQATEKHIVLIKIDADLNYISNNTITNDFHEDVAYNLIQLDAAVYVLGRTNIQDDNTQDIYLVRFTDDLALVLNSRTYGFHGSDETGYGISITDDGEILLSGKTMRSGAISSTNALTLKVDHKSLDIIGELLVNQPFNQTFNSNTMSADGSYIFTGVWGVSDTDDEIFISKVDQNGEGCCYEKTKLNTFSQYKDWRVHFTTMEPKFETVVNKGGSKYYDFRMICGTLNKGNGYVIADNLVPDNNIRLYPNPNNGTFDLSFNKVSKDFTVNIYDLQGRNAFSKEIKNNQALVKKIDAHTCSPGFYFVEIITGNEKWVGKVMIRH